MATLLTSGQGFGGNTGQFKTFYDRMLLERVRHNEVYNRFGQKARIPRRGGKTIEWRRFAALPQATTALTEGTTPNGSDLSFTSVTATVAQYGDFVRGSDLVDVTAIDPIITVATDLLAQQASETFEVVTRAVLEGTTNRQFSKPDDAAATANFPTAVTGIKSAGGVPASLKFIDLVRASKTMFAKRALPVSGSRYAFIITPEQWANLMADPDIRQTWNYGQRDNLIDGEIGTYMGFDFYRTSLPSTANGGATYAGSAVPTGVVAQGGFAIGRQGYGVIGLEGMGLETITKTVGSGGATGDPLNMIWSQGWKAVHKAVILNEDWVLHVVSSVYA